MSRQEFVDEAAKPHFLIWSFRHKAWWGHDAKGYVRKRVSAGRFTYEAAMAQRLDPVSLDKDGPAGDALILECAR